jgi:hypothetical protein
MIHDLALGYLDASAIPRRMAVTLKPLDMGIVRLWLKNSGITRDRAY